MMLLNQKRPRGMVEAFRCGDLLTLSWTDKQQVLMLSTKHAFGNLPVQSR